jgi:hypothetical protein
LVKDLPPCDEDDFVDVIFGVDPNRRALAMKIIEGTTSASMVSLVRPKGLVYNVHQRTTSGVVCFVVIDWGGMGMEKIPFTKYTRLMDLG